MLIVDTYEKAVSYSKNAEFTSNFSSDEDESETKRTRKKPHKVGEDSDADGMLTSYIVKGQIFARGSFL